jgi:hypothetical protein
VTIAVNDSRKEDRLPVALVMRYREPTMLEAREGQCQNVSLSGMCILTQKPSPRGALIRFECVSGAQVEGIRGTGRVVWQRAKSDARGPAGMGVRFVRLEPGCAEALESLIEQLGRERKPSGSTTPRANGVSSTPPPLPANSNSSSPPARSGAAASSNPPPANDTERLQVAQLVVPITPVPSGPTGITQQGMGAQRSRSVHYPTLRGIPASLSQAGKNNPSSNPPPLPQRSTEPDGAEPASQVTRSQPNLHATLPGHATVTGIPFPPSMSAPPPAPDGEPARSTLPTGAARNASSGGGVARERLDRTRRNAPPSNQPIIEAEIVNDENTSRDTWPTGGGSERSKSDRPPAAGGVEDLRGVAQSAARAARTEPDIGSSARSSSVHAEPVDLPPRRRPPRSADLGATSAVLTDGEGSRRRNWLPWVVVGSGVLVSLLLVRMFGTLPSGIFGKEAAVVVPAAGVDGTKPGSTLPASTEQQAVARKYVLEVISDPPGARVSAGGQWVLAPGSLEFGTLNAPLEVRAEFAGRRTTSVTVAPEEFTVENDKLVRRVTLALPADEEPSAAPAAPEAATLPAAPAPATAAAPAPAASSAAAETTAAPEHRASAAKPAATTKRAAATTPPRKPAAPTPAEASPTPQIAQPPVPMDAKPGDPVPALTVTATPDPAPTAPQPAAPSSKPAATEARGSGQTPLAQALECLSRGDNACVIAALQDRAKSERELDVLIETYLAVGNANEAERNMKRYLDAYPDGKSAQRFQRWLERRAGGSAPASAPATPPAP